MKSLWNLFSSSLRALNKLMAYLSAILIVVCSLVLCYEVLTRYVIHVSNDWVIELSVFMLIAATFMAAAHTQRERAHVGIELLDEIMSKRATQWRLLFGDVLSGLFCALVAVLSWEYFWEAYSEGWDSGSTWSPKMWIPYSFMAAGMTLLTLEFVVQTVEGLGKLFAPQSQVATSHNTTKQEA